MTAEHDFPGGVDPLMSAITGEPLPEPARENTALVAEHRSAVSDVAVLRGQLGIIGDALADAADVTDVARDSDVETATARPSGPVRRHRPRPFALALGGLAAVCAVGLVSGMAWLFTQTGTEASNAAADKSAAQADSSEAPDVRFGSPRYLACARLLVEGTVTDVAPAPGQDGQTRITLDVTRTYKPEKPAREGREPLVFPVRDQVMGPLRVGDHALVGFRREGAFPDALFIGEREIATERARIVRSLPESRRLTCPGT